MVNLVDITYPVEALEFVNELINDAINFPQVEGEDGGDEYNEDDYDNLVTQTQTLPNFTTKYKQTELVVLCCLFVRI